MKSNQTQKSQADNQRQEQRTVQAPLCLEADAQGNPLFFLGIFFVLIAIPFFVWNGIEFRSLMKDYAVMAAFIVWALLMVLSLRHLLMKKRLGKLMLHVADALHAGSQNVPVSVHFMPGLGKSMSTAASASPVRFEVSCSHIEDTGEDAKNTCLWSQELPDICLIQGTRSINFLLSLPADLPGSGVLEKKNARIVWHLRVKAGGVVNTFTLPVNAAPIAQSGNHELQEIDSRRY